MNLNIEGKEKRTQSVTCEYCEEIFDFKAEDLVLLNDCPGYKLFTVNCPRCNKRYFVRDRELQFKV